MESNHTHHFLGESQKANERRTLLVIVLTAVMMVVEIAAGLIFGSMALLADGWHMASHAAALSITALGYYLARRFTKDPRFTFGTGKVGDLAGFASALILALIALLMAYESVLRFLSPVAISFNQAILVAVLGLVVNLVSALILKEDHHHHGKHEHHHREHGRHHDHEDHNLKSAYMHVVADALTSVLAILALTAGKYLGWVWMDAAMGIVGALVILRWSYGLMRDTGRILLDANPDPKLSARIREALEREPGLEVTDLHLWRLGPGHLGAIVSLRAESPQPPEHYKAIIEQRCEISHLSVEVMPAGPMDDQDRPQRGPVPADQVSAS